MTKNCTKTSKHAEEALLGLKEDITPADELEVKAHMSWAMAAAQARKVAEEVLEQIKLLWAMLTDPSFVMKWETKAAIVGALVYFISPLDAIPDPIAGVGYLDDAAVVGWVLHRISEEVSRYRKHKKAT